MVRLLLAALTLLSGNYLYFSSSSSSSTDHAYRACQKKNELKSESAVKKLGRMHRARRNKFGSLAMIIALSELASFEIGFRYCLARLIDSLCLAVF
jgi:hypothetical protein